MSAYAKAIVGAVAAVLVTGITAWQAATSDGFQLVDLVPVGIAVGGALLTYVVPNVPELPAAKAWVSGTLAVLAALSTGLTGLSAKADAVQVVFALAGAFLTWYVPNLPAQNLPALAASAPDAAAPAAAASYMVPDLPAAPGPADADPPAMPTVDDAGPLPIEAEAQQAAAAHAAAVDAPTIDVPTAELPPRPAVV